MNYENPKSQIITLVRKAIAEHLPDLSQDQFEESGKVYYINDRNNTVFDWTMNHHLCPFMSFYNSGMGVAKAIVYSDGKVIIDLYRENQYKPFASEKATMRTGDVHLLGVFLFNHADNAGRLGMSIDDLEYV